MKILVVEDEIRIRKGICDLLAKFFPHHEVVGSAENGKAGYELFIITHPDLIITDVKMPEMDGLEMLAKLNSENYRFKAIVVSAYAEFAYAQQAIRYGVSVYLIKPLVVSEFMQSMNSIETALNEEYDAENPDALGKLDYILFGLIFGNMQLDGSLTDFLAEKYKLYADTNFAQLQIYLSCEEERLHPEKNDIILLLQQISGLKYCILKPPKEKKLLLIVYRCDDFNELERRVQNRLLSGTGLENRSDWNVGWIISEGIDNLRPGYHTLSNAMDWNISLGGNILISYPKVLQIQTLVCVYPITIEDSLKLAICSCDYSRILKCIREFQGYFESGAVYQPKEIKDSFIRFIWAFLNTAKEIGILHMPVDHQSILMRVMESINRSELWSVADEVSSFTTASEEVSLTEKALSYHVQKAKNIVSEYYNSGITLEEIASRLCITPEYLSLQFHRETGEKFSDFIREFRIGKAKELLIRSHMKIFEIAERIGYSDAKYFSRVFKEYTGQLPADYRKTHK